MAYLLPDESAAVLVVTVKSSFVSVFSTHNGLPNPENT
jgi:hypothetical protein